MKFCNGCDNMLYIRLLKEDSNKLIYYCRNCGNSYDEINKDNLCVLNTVITSKEKAYLQDINEYTKLDPTLPRTLNIKCPNQSCPSNEKSDLGELSKNEVIYLRYDDINLNYVYICTQCDTIWKTNEQ
ncbi:DNA-directed RNA polymerase, subunit M/Transcription elongation factor TFIIS/RPB9 [Chrysochromulina ericina virus CeV-01B]|uniref:DNA-directed RNA polymerase, subunit M/Transcription elongation factor TFIIS/RPB9 n=1 Tax=Chrysochromulina ericina virus CeV-01B TaxID=3070830 RepID=A0A0N9Q9G4_9VIRU|nr:DNA-directed RNA polymerase, subunit M/Transcription elongation factor TFIIS/RPB9 [Chrysochromulina ericina virus]ALH23172.1 DNA-directed RNA polymerase, subunit M/Transcription elongation factor TFIIS/RPB9 [Chrysochromulina ericina virus CeV-01B]|tara:strand:+ start:1001 stop:1384 length:384 start_codon:yes stop_codon:yes gene_type:complete